MLRIGLAMLLAVAAWGQQYSISTLAGGPPPLSMSALDAIIGTPARIAVDNNGNAYFSNDWGVFRLDSLGTAARVCRQWRKGVFSWGAD